MTPFTQIGVVGAGFMGTGIAESAARAGLGVHLYEPSAAPLERSRSSLSKSINHAVDRGKLSQDDAEWIYPGLPVDEVIDLILAFGPRVVAVTLGAHGAVAGSEDARVRVAGIPVTVADTVGAGDSFGAALIAALVDEGAFGPDASLAADTEVLTRAVSYAVAASAITCSRTGAAPPSRDEIEAELRGVELASEGA